MNRSPGMRLTAEEEATLRGWSRKGLPSSVWSHPPRSFCCRPKASRSKILPVNWTPGRRGFPGDGSDSRRTASARFPMPVIQTTRFKSFPCNQHHFRPLDQVDSWSGLQHQLDDPIVGAVCHLNAGMTHQLLPNLTRRASVVEPRAECGPAQRKLKLGFLTRRFQFALLNLPLVIRPPRNRVLEHPADVSNSPIRVGRVSLRQIQESDSGEN